MDKPLLSCFSLLSPSLSFSLYMLIYIHGKILSGFSLSFSPLLVREKFFVFGSEKQKRQKEGYPCLHFLLLLLISHTTPCSFKKHINSIKKTPSIAIFLQPLRYKYHQHHSDPLLLQSTGKLKQDIQEYECSTMPTLPSSIMILFFLCISLHASDGRHLRIMNEDHYETEFEHSNKANDQKGTFSVSPKLIPLLSNESEVVDQGSLVNETRVHNDSPKKNYSEADGERLKEQRMRGTNEAVDSPDSFVSVSWRIPQKNKQRDEHPGFNLDYSPPKTHPPIHN